MNEGCATFVHHYILNELFQRGQIGESAMMEFMHSHSSVVFQPDFDDQRYSGINPYALGFAMMQDIRRICESPKDEDRELFPDIAGSGAWLTTPELASEGSTSSPAGHPERSRVAASTMHVRSQAQGPEPGRLRRPGAARPRPNSAARPE